LQVFDYCFHGCSILRIAVSAVLVPRSVRGFVTVRYSGKCFFPSHRVWLLIVGCEPSRTTASFPESRNQNTVRRRLLIIEHFER
jgi:hypothetical protein